MDPAVGARLDDIIGDRQAAGVGGHKPSEPHRAVPRDSREARGGGGGADRHDRGRGLGPGADAIGVAGRNAEAIRRAIDQPSHDQIRVGAGRVGEPLPGDAVIERLLEGIAGRRQR